MRSRRLQPIRWARWVRRATMLLGIACVVWFFVKFDTRWVPAGMNTVPSIPAGSWLVLDSWSSGLRVGSDVLIDTPHGELLSRVVDLTDDTVSIQHPNELSGWVDSLVFGALPRDAVRGVVVVAFGPSDGGR